MIDSDVFNPNECVAACQDYLSRSLGKPVRLLGAEQLTKSTRQAPWRLDIDIEGSLQSFVLRLGIRNGEHEFAVLQAMEAIPIPTPRAYGWDPDGLALGHPCFFYDFIQGESLLGPVRAGEPWAEALFLDTVCALQSVTREQLSSIEARLKEEVTAEGVLEEASMYFKANPNRLAEAVYARLRKTMPSPPAVRFSNGDLWLGNLIVRDRRLVGVIDFERAGFSDPIFEFLLSFFVEPQLRGRGIEERYCRRMGFDASVLPWYHGLEYFDTWRWVLSTGESFVQYTAENLPQALAQWLDEV